MERQGPGSPEVTLKALSFVDGLTDESLIADIGCGTGGQTMVLAGHVPGQITGIDLFPGFIDIFNRNARQLGLQDRVKGIVGSMDALPFGEEELDMIWCEGAIYNIGFERGLKEWRKYLKPGGYIAVSESSWFTDDALRKSMTSGWTLTLNGYTSQSGDQVVQGRLSSRCYIHFAGELLDRALLCFKGCGSGDFP